MFPTEGISEVVNDCLSCNMKKILGRTDKANFPKLWLKDIAIKMDTGAYTSSIHCNNIRENNNVLKCTFLDEERPNYNHQLFTFEKYKITSVKSSNGIIQKRYEIKSTVEIFGKTYKISLTLSDRKEMRYPVLIGRKFLSKKFIVDPQLTDVSYNASKK